MSAAAERIDYLNPDLPAVLPWHELTLIEVPPQSRRGYGGHHEHA
jgi:hypothetical protein